jgi:hypothetical protein
LERKSLERKSKTCLAGSYKSRQELLEETL